MKHISKYAAVAGITVALAASPVQANEDSDAALAALLLLGAAALVHNEDHHPDGKHYTRAEQIAAYEQGFKDGLHNESYSSNGRGPSYNDGFAAGHKERENKIAAQRNNHAKHGTPVLAMRGCVGVASARWSRNPRDIVVVNSRKVASNDFLVEVAVGHKHGKCEVNKNGDVRNFERGRM